MYRLKALRKFATKKSQRDSKHVLNVFLVVLPFLPYLLTPKAAPSTQVSTPVGHYSQASDRMAKCLCAC
jgi:hypothetical protein